MLSDPMVMLTHSAPSAPSPSTATPQLRASTWWRWGTKRSRQNGGHDGGAMDTDSSNSSAASSSVSATIVVLAALTAATASITYHVYQLLTRSSYRHRRQSAPRCRPRTRHGEVLGSSPASEIAMESVDTAAPLSHNTARSGSSTGWRSSSVDGCGSAAAHVVARANPSSAVGSEGELDQGHLREEDVGVRQLSLIPVAGIATDAGALCGNRDMSFGQHSGLSSHLAHVGTAALHDRRTTSATAANPSPPPPATPRVLLSSPYDLESYGLQGLAGGAHGWRRVFGLLKPEPRRRSERDGPFAEDRDAAVAGAPGYRAPRSLTRTYEDSRVTAIEDPALLRESVRAIAQATAAAETKSPAQSTSTAASIYRSDVVRSDVSVHSSTSRQSVTMAKPHTAQWYSHDRQLSSLTATTAVSTSTNVSTQQSPSPRLILPAAEAPTPPSRFLNSLSFHVLHYLSFCASRSTGGNAPGVNTTAGEANSSTAGSGMHTMSTAHTYVTSAALAMAQRNLQRDISALVAATASVRPAASASSTSSASRTHTACCSTMSLVTVPPRAADTAFCKSQLRDQEVAAAEPCLSVVTLHTSSSRSIGQSRKGLTAEEEEGAAQHVVGSRVLMEEDGQQQGIGRSPNPQGTDVCHEEPDSSWQHDISVTRSGRSQCGVSMLDSAQERKVAPLPSLTTPSGVAAAAVGAAAECCVSPVLLKEASTEASDAAGTEPTGAPRFPPSTAHRRTIAEQLAVLTGRREQQRLYTQQLLESRRLTRLGSGVENGLVSPLATPSSLTYADAAGVPAMMDFRSTELSSTSTSGMCGPSSGASQYYTDTAPGVYYSSLLQLYHYESHAYSDITTEVQQWRRQRQWDHIASLGACAPTTPKARVGDEGVVNGAHTTTRMATGVATAKATASRRSMERSAVETSLTAATEATAALKASASAGTAGLTSGVGSVAPLGQSKLASPSNERRVDDLTVKQQDDGSASYSISLTYHDSETGTSRTVKTSALPPLRRCDAGALPPGLSSLSGGPAVRPAPHPTHPAAMAAALTSLAAGVTIHTHSRSVSGGAAAHARAAGSALALPEMVTATGKSLLQAQRCRAFNAEDKNAASTTLCLAEEARASGERPRLAARRSSSARGILKCCNSSVPALAAADAASANPPCNTEATATPGRILPFAAPLPPTEPQHGPRLRGVAGRNGEMAIGAFLGGGACGKVYECLNTETGQVLAAKQIVFDAKDRRLRTRLKQLELELEVLTLAARHHVPWIVGFFGAEKRGHSVLMYLEYCRHGSLLDYMVEGNSADAAVWSPSAAPDGAAPQLLTGHAGGSSGRSFDANGSPPVAAVETRGRNADTMNNAANSLITNSPLQGLREVRKRHNQPAAAPTLSCQEQQRQQQQQTTDVGSTTTGEVQREETEAAATSGHASPHVCTRQEESVEGEEYAAHRGEAGLAVAAASVSSSASSVVFSGSALDTMPLSEALNPQMPPLSIEQAQRFAKQIVEGLCFLHQHNYAHLDVKTANVLVAADEECRLADLGCAMRLQPPPPSSLWQQQGGPAGTGNPVKGGPDGDLDDALSPPPYPVLVDRDAITELRGTALYMAPEMIRFESHVIGSPADVWSLGCVVMEMTTGCAPWRHISKDKLRVLYRIGSARDELPLPPLIHAWAEKAREWLAQERLSATAAAEQQDVVEACAMEADDVAQAPCSCSATKMYPEDSDVDRSNDVVCGNRDKAASDKLGEPCSSRRRLEQGASGSDSSSMAVDRAGKQGPPAFSVVDTSRSSCEANATQRSWSSLAPEMPAALSTFTTSARASASSLSFARVVSAPTAGPLIDPTKGDDENAAAVEAEERLFRGQSRVMHLYVALEDFVAACVKLRPEDRSSAAELLRHPFLTLCKDDV
ncbi:putative Protein tyrosine kinase/Protein kinase domain containing protein [Leishmania utingensis]|uniref:Protein kinase domain-containing protein n=1 Tax=Leishmania utingensis TaxID=653362 RepID=A0AAW3AZ54_9TRYP